MRLAIAIDPAYAHLRSIVTGIVAWSREHGCEVVHRAGNLSAAELGDGVDAIIFQGRIAETRQALRNLPIPAVVVSGRSPPGILPAVLPDDRAIGQMAAQYLQGLGLRHFACAGIGESFWFSRERLDGFRSALPEATVEEIPWDGVRAWLGQVKRPTGVFAANDHHARSMCELAVQAGVPIPEQLAIVGVDDDAYFTESSPIGLSSVQLDGGRQGRIAAELALRLHRDRSAWPVPATLTLIPPRRVIARKSSDILHLEDPRLGEFVRLIRSPEGLRMSIDAALRRTGLGRRSAERLLQQCLNTTPAAEQHRMRMMLAKELLEDTQQDMNSIALACGWSSGQTFMRSFAAEVGETPGAYRTRRAILRS